MKKALLLTLVICLMAVPIYAEEKDDRITALEEKVADLEERLSAIENIFKKAATPSGTGSGEFYISGPSGSTERGESVIFYVDEDHEHAINSLSVISKDLDGSLLTYIYIDDVLNTKVQMANSMNILMLQGYTLDEGIHTVRAVQYADNDEEGGEVLFEKTEEYEVKYK